jgi:hypothetical protein
MPEVTKGSGERRPIERKEKQQIISSIEISISSSFLGLICYWNLKKFVPF